LVDEEVFGMNRPIRPDSVAFEGAVDGLHAIVRVEAVDDCPTEGPIEDSILQQQQHHHIDEEAWVLCPPVWAILRLASWDRVLLVAAPFHWVVEVAVEDYDIHSNFQLALVSSEVHPVVGTWVVRERLANHEGAGVRADTVLAIPYNQVVRILVARIVVVVASVHGLAAIHQGAFRRVCVSCCQEVDLDSRS
jgi:hypothetical protein